MLDCCKKGKSFGDRPRKGRIFYRFGCPPVLPYTREFIFMEDGEVALLSPHEVKVFNTEGNEISKKPKRVNWSPLMAEKGGYKHFMLKEIFEQPRAVIDTIRVGSQRRRAMRFSKVSIWIRSFWEKCGGST